MAANVHSRQADGDSEQRFSEMRTQLFVLGLFRFSEALAWTSIFPYAYFMVQSFGEGSKANTAFLVGLLIAIFTFCEFLTGTLWAKASDKIGRKPILLIGVLGAMISATLFGLSKSIYAAVAIRALGGLANPNVGVVQTCIGETVKKKGHQAKAFSIVPFLRGFGSVFGPVIGGILAEPVKRFPSTFHSDTLWERNPFLLPNLAVTTFLAITWFVGFLFLRETHIKYNQRRDIGRDLISTVRTTLEKVLLRKAESSYEIIENDEDQSEGQPALLSTMSDAEDDGVELKMRNQPAQDVEMHETSAWVSMPQTPYTRQVILQILSVSLLAFHKVASDTLIPVFLAKASAESDRRSLVKHSFLELNGGFGMDIATIGNILLTQAVVAIVSQLVAVPYIIERFGALRTYRWTMFIFPWMYCLTPFVVKLPSPLSIMALLLDLWVKVLLAALGYVCSAILITNTVPATEYLATINGVSASFSCLARSIGPMTTGPLFDWSSKRDIIGLPFWIMSGVSAIAALEAWLLRDHP